VNPRALAAHTIRPRAAAIFLVACMGCRGADDTPKSLPTSTPAPALAPADHLAPGELLEGADDAFGLTLPQKLRVDSAFAQVVYASGTVAVHPLASYFSARLQGGNLREGDMAATFEHVHVPTRPERELAVHIAGIGQMARVEIRDTTPPQIPALSDERARWKRVGTTPQGHLLDPTHLD
jgi:hypothetical protein